MTEKDVSEAREAELPDVPAPTREELAAALEELEETVQTLNNLLSSLSARMLRNVDDLKDEVGRRVGFADIQVVQKDLEKIRAKIDDIVDEVGYGEALDITKVPPEILEAAYQTILDDVLEELRKARGSHDAEQHILHSLEQLRLKMSGSELFHYKPHRIHVGVAKAMAKNLVSARQVQMTYEELLRHLLEPIHYHAPKNFRAIVKIKTQEYAVDTATKLGRDVAHLGPKVDGLAERVMRLEQVVADALKDMQEFTHRLQSTLASVATRESVEALGMRMAALEGSRAPPSDGPSDRDAAARILEAVREKPRTLAALRKDLGMDEGELKAVLEDLERQGHVSSSKRGRSTVYETKEADENA